MYLISAKGRTVMKPKIMFRKKKKEENNDPFFLNGASNSQGVLMRFSMPSMEEKKGHLRFTSTFSFPPVYAYVNHWGEIKTESEEGQRIAKREQEKAQEEGKKAMLLKMSFFMGALTFVITAIFALFFSDDKTAVINVIGGAMICYGLCKVPQYVRDVYNRITKQEDFMKFTAFHAAEHIVTNAYNHLKRMPTYEELKNYSKHSYYCSYCNEISSGWFWFVFGLCWAVYGIPYIWILVALAAISFMVLELIGYVPLGAIYVSEPEEKHLKTALTALGKAIEVRASAEESLIDSVGDAACINVIVKMGQDEEGNIIPSGIIISMGEEPNEDDTHEEE